MNTVRGSIGCGFGIEKERKDNAAVCVTVTHSPFKRNHAGSTPVGGTICALNSIWLEYLPLKQNVEGSSPSERTMLDSFQWYRKLVGGKWNYVGFKPLPVNYWTRHKPYMNEYLIDTEEWLGLRQTIKNLFK